ncbi:sodium-coupled monocarboxylate transporter 1 [Onthophagus taurus]|uniref:sodium-coupled monocarboxylate transporter 1 n=1 Tax=Onthophagus taurus TaxID=166361 RepID=UPI000C20543F|nr:sodium-coupled monocarboxylate transporter 1 [Onthophagus taurus]
MNEVRNMAWDYVVFVVFVIATTFVAVYSRCFGPKEKTKADFVFAAGKVSMGAMMLSIARGTLGVRSFLGYPSELFYRGSTMWETLYGMILAYPIVCYIFVPVYFSLGITSVYQYLDLRFKSRLVRCLASGTYIIRQLLNQGVTVFTPCVALNTIIGMPYWLSICGISFVSIIFTLLGGLKAAIWADVMQGLTMIAVSVAIIVQGCIEGGGALNVVQENYDGGRLGFFNFDTDPTIRVTTISAVVGQLFMSLSIFGCQQNFVQRYCSMDSQSKVTKTLMYNIPVITVLFSLSWVVGMVIYAIYASCDPLSAGYIKKFDEILPFYMEDRFSYIPGILGLFIATLFNGALSLNVSNLNSLATVTFEDFLRPLPALKGLRDKHQLYWIKAISVVYGLAIMGISFGIGLLSGVIESSMLVTSATSGPLLGVFLLAMLVPCCNWKGAAVGVIAGHLTTLWITFGSLYVEKKPEKILDLTIDGCTNNSFSEYILKDHPFPQRILNHQYTIRTTTAEPRIDLQHEDAFTQIHSITYMYYSLIGCFVTVFLGWIISYFTASETDRYDENLIHPIARKIASFFPGKQRHYTDGDEIARGKSIDDDKIPTLTAVSMERLPSAAYSQEVSLDSESCNTKL